jgi:hypothetical protein
MPTNKKLIFGLLALAMLLLVFKLGIIVGRHQAGFAERFGDNYHRTFIDPHSRFWNELSDRRPPPNQHGAVGKIVSLTPTLAVIAGPDQLERSIELQATSTLVRRFRDEATLADLHVGDQVVVLGTPATDGAITATLIRIITPPPK